MSYFKHKNLLANMCCGRNIYLLYSVFGLFELFVTTLKLMPFSCNKLRDSVCSPTYVGDVWLSGCSGPVCWPSSNMIHGQVNLKSCCVVPEELSLFVKENGVTLLTHSDPSEILPEDGLRWAMIVNTRIFMRLIKLKWHISKLWDSKSPNRLSFSIQIKTSFITTF